MICEEVIYWAVCDECNLGYRNCIEYDSEDVLIEQLEISGWKVNEEVLCPDCQK